MSVTGIVLAAGAGSRAGFPKALAREPDGTPWLHLAVAALAPCDRVIVVLGAGVDNAQALDGAGVDNAHALGDAGADDARPLVAAGADDARALVPAGAETVIAEHWARGQSASLVAGLDAATGDAALVTLVDLPGLPLTAVERMLRPATRASLAQAVYGSRPGHPVLLGADHWSPLRDQLAGDRGARPYLVAHGVLEVECGDLWHGRDDDRPTRYDPR